MSFSPGKLNLNNRDSFDSLLGRNDKPIPVPERQQELIAFAVKHGNPLEFIESGFQEVSIPTLKISTENSLEVTSYINNVLETIQKFISSPLFTDQFHRDHKSRRVWESNNLLYLSPELKEYYSSNKLNTNSFWAILSFIELIIEHLNNTEIKKTLSSILERFPSILSEVDKNKVLEYNKVSDKEKILAIQETTKLFQEIINLFTTIEM